MCSIRLFLSALQANPCSSWRAALYSACSAALNLTVSCLGQLHFPFSSPIYNLIRSCLERLCSISLLLSVSHFHTCWPFAWHLTLFTPYCRVKIKRVSWCLSAKYSIHLFFSLLPLTGCELLHALRLAHSLFALHLAVSQREHPPHNA